MKLILNLTALLMVLVDISHENHESGFYQLQDFYKQRPPIVVNCLERSAADNKAQLLLNQDITTLRNYFNEKCSMSSSLCKRMTVPQFEQKICELRRLKAKLFPQGTNGPAQPITAFDCNRFTPEEKQGCPRPGPVGAGTFATYSPFPFTDSGPTRNIPWQTVRNNWDRVIQEKINEYIDKMKVYESTGGGGSLFGGSSFSSTQTIPGQTMQIPGNFFGFQASRAPTSARRPLYSTFSRLESSADLQARPSGWAFNSRQPGVGIGSRNFLTRSSQPSGGVNPYSGANFGATFGLGGFGGASTLAGQLYQQAQEINMCLPSGAVTVDGKTWRYGLSYGTNKVSDPLLAICRVREDPKLFDSLEYKLFTEFYQGMMSLCASYPNQIQAEINRYVGSSDPMTIVRNQLNQPNSAAQIIITSCAVRELHKKIKNNDPSVMNILNCNRFQQQLERYKDVKKFNAQNNLFYSNPYSFYGEKRETWVPFMEEVTCKTSLRDLFYEQYGNAQLAFCMMKEDITDSSYSSYYTFHAAVSRYFGILTQLYILLNRLPVATPNNVNAQNILNNNYLQVNLPGNTRPDNTESWIAAEGDKLAIANTVFDTQSGGNCNGVLQNNQITRNYQTMVSSVVNDCQRGDRGVFQTIFDKTNEIFKALSDSNAQNNNIKICMIYTLANSLPESGRNTQNFRRIIFASKLMEMVEEEVEKASAIATSNTNCEAQMTPLARQSLGVILTKFATGELQGIKNEMQTILCPSDVAVPLTEADRKRYNACMYKKIFDLSNTQTCQAFGNLMNTVRQEINNKMEIYRNGGPVDIKQEIALILKRPSSPALVTPATQSLGGCTGDRQVTPQGNFVCPPGIQCCANQQAICENNQCRIAVWQETFCKHAAAAQGKSNTDPQKVFMDMLMKGDILKEQELYAKYSKYSSNSAECQNVLRLSDNNGQSSINSFGQYGGVSPFVNPYMNPSGSLFGSGGFGTTTSSTMGYSNTLMKLRSAAYSSQSGFGYLGNNNKCTTSDNSDLTFICTWHMVFPTFASNACPQRNMANPLFPDYNVDYDVTSTYDLYCNMTGQNTDYDSLYGVGGVYNLGGFGTYEQKPQPNKDCAVYTDAQAKAARTGVDVGFLVMEKYRESIFGGSLAGGSYNAYSSSFGNTYQATSGYSTYGATPTMQFGAGSYGGQAGHGPQGGSPDSTNPSADGLTYF